MKLPVNKNIIDYIHELDITVPELVHRGANADAIYRMLRGECQFLNDDNTSRLAKALRISEMELLKIATGTLAVAEEPAIYRVMPPELRELIDAWPHLCEIQQIELRAYIRGFLGASKNMDKKAAGAA